MKMLLIGMTLIVFLASCGTSDVPEMEEFMSALSSQEKTQIVANEYSATQGIIPEALWGCHLGSSRITNTEEKSDTVVFTVEVVVDRCEKSETAVGTVRTFDIAWKDGKVISFDWKGPKSGKVEY
jgi:ketosteroid isomerase-like protein